MELILFAILIGIVIAIVALPIWLMINVNVFLGIGIICLYDFIIYKIYDVPAISVIVSFVLRLGLFLLLVAIILFGILFIFMSCYDVTIEKFEDLPGFLHYVSTVLKMLRYYIT